MTTNPTVKPVAFSYSRLNNFEECPKKFYAIAIAKEFQEKESDQMRYGKDVHKALELRVAKNKPLPSHLQHLEPMMQKILAAPGRKLPEQQLAINANFEPCEWFDKEAYCRAIVDLAVIGGKRAVLFDYKTGKISDDFTQMRLTGAVFMQHYPEIEELTLAYLWIKERKPTREEMTRADIPVVWEQLLPRINRYQTAFVSQSFPPRPGRACRSCPVTACPYWSRR